MKPTITRQEKPREEFENQQAYQPFAQHFKSLPSVKQLKEGESATAVDGGKTFYIRRIGNELYRLELTKVG